MEEASFDRIERLLGTHAMGRLFQSHILLFGLGGVGGQCAEALARSGVGHFVLVDGDRVSITNINRQIVALHSTLGRQKAEIMRERIRDINPKAIVEDVAVFYRPAEPLELWNSPFDLVIDAIDDIPAKVEIALQAQARKIPCVSCMGAGNKLNPMGFLVADLYETSVCPLCRSMRKRARERGIASLQVVYSKETPTRCSPPSENSAEARAPGSAVFATAAAGLLLAAEAVRMLLSSPECVE